MKCIIIDDDVSVLAILEHFVEKIDEIELVGKFTEPILGLNAIKVLSPDLLIVDVEMPGISGLDVIKILPVNIEVILITGSKEYAIDGFELNVVDYLLKPVTFDRFLKAINRFFIRKTKALNPNIEKKENESEIQNSIYVKENYKTVKIPLSNIIYLESFKEYVIIYTEKRQIKTKQRLVFFEKENFKPNLIRIHKSYIVSVDKILSYTGTEIEVSGKILPIGRIYRNNILTILDNKNNIH